ncbi:MAG: PcfJ domain-containing protein, partial [Schwartzia sp.]|nr:PcfJ domain-containing protein [Schwartzia sp. (in: firmicutes)]
WTDALTAWDGTGGEIDIPPIVADAVLEALREGTFLVEGIRPSVLSGITGKAKIMAFIRRPFDLNVVFLKDFLCMSDTKFDSIFPYEEKNIYQRICRYLNIRPPKSLRRAYTFNPYAIVWFMLFLQWGVRDINFMRPFFLLDVRIGPAYIRQFRYDRSTGGVESADAENWDMNCEWEAFDRYCQFLKRTKGERAMMRWLYRYSSRDYLSREQQDTIEAVFEYGQFFPEDVMERLRKDGLTGQVHCLVSQAVAYISMQEDPDFELPYDPLCLEAECDVNEYRFRLIHNIGDLIDAGIELQNCVASYQRRIMNGQSSIFVVRKKRQMDCLHRAESRPSDCPGTGAQEQTSC